MWLSHLANAAEVSIRWPGAERQPVGLTLNKCQSGLSQWARLEIPDKLLKPTFPPSPYIARTPHTHTHTHTPINSSPLLSLGWRLGPIQKVSALRSRVGWTPARKERTNQRTNERTNDVVGSLPTIGSQLWWSLDFLAACVVFIFCSVYWFAN